MGLKIGALLGKLNPVAMKSKVFVIGGIVLLVFIIWAGMKWDAMKILDLEKDNQRLEIERETAKESVDQAEALRTIDEDVVRDTLNRSDAIAQETAAVREKVRNDVREIQQELAGLQDQRQSQMEELEKLELARLDLERAETGQGNETSPPRVVVREVAVPGPSVDARVAERLVSGLWHHYCGQVPDDRRCPSRRPAEEGTAGESTE